MKKSLIKGLANFKENLVVRLPNTPESSKNGDVGLKSQLKMLWALGLVKHGKVKKA